jgi:hypothetical protein
MPIQQMYRLRVSVHISDRAAFVNFGLSLTKVCLQLALRNVLLIDDSLDVGRFLLALMEHAALQRGWELRVAFDRREGFASS